ncbi:unnamed protein product [Clonostachys byssicola]|uniref:Glyoxalase-like domain-containing protein n=1 Tax=Clonostachys byssicola TaxID=160290 RepID=A0A9N9U6I1_9HYPO|nr:unnamed protein product [Clonostachys byssicola]
MTAVPLADHFVIVVPYPFLASPPSWLTDAFTVSQGGKHADGVTENILVHFPDGSYIELIAFAPGVDPSKRAGHRWGHKHEGTVADWALTLNPAKSGDDKEDIHGAAAFRKIQQDVLASQPEIRYPDPVRGGRLRPDGAELKWAVSGPKRQDGQDAPIEPGQTPFWCLDSTPRNLRVPFEEPGATDHPSGILGVARVEIGRVGDVQKSSLQGVYNALLGAQQSEEWQISSYVGSLHPGTRVAIVEGKKQGEIGLSFYTKDSNWAGKSVGGSIDGQTSISFKVIGI